MKRIIIRGVIALLLISWVWRETAMLSITVTMGVMFAFIELTEYAVKYLTFKVYGVEKDTAKVAKKLKK